MLLVIYYYSCIYYFMQMESVLLKITCHYKHMHVSYSLLPNIQYVQYLHKKKKQKTNKKQKQNIEAKQVLWRPQLSYNRLVFWSISNTKRIVRMRERESRFTRSFSGSVVEWTIVTLARYIYTHRQGKHSEIWMLSAFIDSESPFYWWIFLNTLF